MRSLLARSIVPTLALALLSGLQPAVASTPRTLVDRDARGRPLSAAHVPLDEATVPMPGIRSRVFTYDDRDNPLSVAEAFDVGPQRGPRGQDDRFRFLGRSAATVAVTVGLAGSAPSTHKRRRHRPAGAFGSQRVPAMEMRNVILTPSLLP